MKYVTHTRTWIQLCWPLACGGDVQDELVSRWKVQPPANDQGNSERARTILSLAPTPLLEWVPPARPVLPASPPPAEVERYRRPAIRASKPLRRFEIAIKADLDGREWVGMPETELDCEALGWGDTVPCPKVGCRHHLGIDVTRMGALHVIMPHWDDGAPACPATCVLVEASRREHTAAEMGELLGITAWRVGQIESTALAKVAARFNMTADELRRVLERQRGEAED